MREPNGDVGREAFTGSERAVRLSPEMDKPSESRDRDFSRRQHFGGGMTVVAEVSSGSENTARARGSPGTREGSSSPPKRVRSGDRGPNPRPGRDAPFSRGSERSGAWWYRQAKATKRGETGVEQSERLVVPLKWGNRPKGPHRGKGAPGEGAVGGNDVRDSEPE